MDSNGYLKFRANGPSLMRRVQGDHDLRLDGIGDLLHRARGASVFDIGCNRGKVGEEFARNGASRVMGCDIDEPCIWVCRENFADMRAMPHRFEVVDLVGGETAFRKAFGKDADLKHDIVLMLATYHKIRRVFEKEGRLGDLAKLMQFFGSKTAQYFGWRGYEHEIKELDGHLAKAGLKRIHTSMISDIQPAAIWARL